MNSLNFLYSVYIFIGELNFLLLSFPCLSFPYLLNDLGIMELDHNNQGKTGSHKILPLQIQSSIIKVLSSVLTIGRTQSFVTIIQAEPQMLIPHQKASSLFLIKKKFMIIMEMSINNSKDSKKFLCLCPALFPLERTDLGTICLTFQGLLCLVSLFSYIFDSA